MKFTHPVWLVGFRPFFILTMISGIVLPISWAMLWSGQWELASSPVSLLQWHAHEMFYGFGWAVLCGFLLTASKNWVHVRGHHGLSLAVLVVAWLFERVGMIWGGGWPSSVFLISNNLFLILAVVLILFTLFSNSEKATYGDNVYFLLILPVFWVAKGLLLSPEKFLVGTSMTLALFRMAFLIMLERTLTQFMKNGFHVDILRNPLLDHFIKTMALLMVIAPFLPSSAEVMIGAALVVALAVRFLFWKPLIGLRRIDIGVMYLGYLGIILHLTEAVISHFFTITWVGAVPMHIFTFGVMGFIIPAMLIRISNGHTGRKVQFDALNRGCLWLMVLGFFTRVLIPQLFPQYYLRWVEASALLWLICFGVIAVRHIPMLLAPRIDGREH